MVLAFAVLAVACIEDPAGGLFRLAGDRHGWVVRDEKGTVVARPGGDTRLAGGEIAYLHAGIRLFDDTRRLAEEACPGRYWIVGSAARGR